MIDFVREHGGDLEDDETDDESNDEDESDSDADQPHWVAALATFAHQRRLQMPRIMRPTMPARQAQIKCRWCPDAPARLRVTGGGEQRAFISDFFLLQHLCAIQTRITSCASAASRRCPVLQAMRWQRILCHQRNARSAHHSIAICCGAVVPPIVKDVLFD